MVSIRTKKKTKTKRKKTIIEIHINYLIKVSKVIAK